MWTAELAVVLNTNPVVCMEDVCGILRRLHSDSHKYSWLAINVVLFSCMVSIIPHGLIFLRMDDKATKLVK